MLSILTTFKCIFEFIPVQYIHLSCSQSPELFSCCEAELCLQHKTTPHPLPQDPASAFLLPISMSTSMIFVFL